MSTEYRVVVKGGGHNLYYIREYDDDYHVYCRTVNLLTNDDDHVGSAGSLATALVLIVAHSGEDIDDIREL